MAEHPKPFNCVKKCCENVVEKVIFNRIYHLCDLSAICINVMESCPLEVKIEPAVKVKRSRSQSKAEMLRQIKMAKMRKEAREFDYTSHINNLLKKY